MKKLLFAVVVVAMVLMSVMPAFAQGVNTSAEVGAANGGAPVVVAAWFGQPTQDSDPTAPGLQVVPNAGTNGGLGTTEICLWMVLWDPYGLSNITGAPTDFYEPSAPCGGTQVFKIQQHATVDGACGPTGAGTARLRAAINAGLVYFNAGAVGVVPGITTAGGLEDVYTQLHNCGLVVYRVCFTYDNHQYPGCYTAEIRPTNATGGQGYLLVPCGWLWIEEIFAFAKDFSVLDWDAIARGVEDWVMGNAVWGDGIPTVHNQGNVDVYVELLFTRMYQLANPNSPKYIDWFDARFLDNDYDPIYATTAYLPTSPSTWTPAFSDVAWYRLTQDVLIPCTPTKIDFSLHPPADLLAGEYAGLAFLRAVDAVSGDCQ